MGDSETARLDAELDACADYRAAVSEYEALSIAVDGLTVNRRADRSSFGPQIIAALRAAQGTLDQAWLPEHPTVDVPSDCLDLAEWDDAAGTATWYLRIAIARLVEALSVVAAIFAAVVALLLAVEPAPADDGDDRPPPGVLMRAQPKLTNAPPGRQPDRWREARIA